MCWPELLIERPKSFFLNPKVLPSICLEGRTQLPEDVLDAFDWALISPPQKKKNNKTKKPRKCSLFVEQDCIPL